MKTWTMSAIRNYYLNPEIVFVDAGHRDPANVLAREGYYIAPHCDPDCCEFFGGVSRADFGPFLTADNAREWSVKNMVSTD